MKKIYFFFLFYCLFYTSWSQNATISPTSLTPPKLTYEQIVSLASPEEGQMVYDISFKCLRMYNGRKWICLTQNTSPDVVAHQAGSTATDIGRAITVDSQGNIYITGNFSGVATFGNTRVESIGSNDVFVAKYNHYGLLQWVRRGGGFGYSYGKSIGVDNSGNVYITGSFYSRATFGNIALTSVRGDDIFIAKYDTNGVLQWVKQGGGDGDDDGKALVVDDSGNVYVTGYFIYNAIFDGTSFPSSTYPSTFIAKYNSNGELQWIKRETGAGAVYAAAIAMDTYGFIYVTGSFYYNSVFGNITPLVSAGGSDVFIAKYSTEGVFQWAKREGGTNNDVATSIAVTHDGFFYVSGAFFGTVNFGGSTSRTAMSNTNTDGFIAGYRDNGEFAWVRQLGGTDYELVNSLSLHRYGGLYVTGLFEGTVNFGFNVTCTSKGKSDVFVARYDEVSGNIEWIEQYGGSWRDSGVSVKVGTNRDVYVTGGFESDVIFGNTLLSNFGYSIFGEGGMDMFWLRLRK
ncbi:SBBP repeat-containing protein [Runella sp.]|uniref:SBBP repeat-containing protein n=1 Tax=Runella sp. TaxID=1960881 RepID=UPI003D0F1B72